MRAISRETTLTPPEGAKTMADQAGEKLASAKQELGKVLGLGAGEAAGTTAAPRERLETIVDDRFVQLRQLVAGDGKGAPIDGVTQLLNDVYVQLSATETAIKDKVAPPPGDAAARVKAESARLPEPIRSMLQQLSSAGTSQTLAATRESLSSAVGAQVGQFCHMATDGRYPFVRSSNRDVTREDFARLFAPGGLIDDFFQKNLAPFVDTSTRPWSFKRVQEQSLGGPGNLAQFQRAATIRDVFFRGGGSVRLDFKPLEMDPAITQFTLDVDGQLVKYAHGPQVPQSIQWPGSKGGVSARIQITPPGPGGTSGQTTEGAWALFRLFDKARVEGLGAPRSSRSPSTSKAARPASRSPPAACRTPSACVSSPSSAAPAGCRAPAMQAPAGWYGKLPILGDFTRRRLPPAFIDPWDAWLQAGIAGSRAALGGAWLDNYLTAHVWHFVLMPGVLGPRPGPACGARRWTGSGATSPSRWRRPAPPGGTPAAVSEWLGGLEDIARLGLQLETDITPLDDALERLGPPLATPTAPCRCKALPSDWPAATKRSACPAPARSSRAAPPGPGHRQPAHPARRLFGVVVLRRRAPQRRRRAPELARRIVYGEDDHLFAHRLRPCAAARQVSDSDNNKTIVLGGAAAAASPPPAPQRSSGSDVALPPGTRLSEFEIVDLVGQGGFGIVYLADDHSLQRRVAVKEYMPSSLATRGRDASVIVRSERHEDTFQVGLRSFVNEARLLAQFDHPALLKVYRFWEANGTAYMAMPYYAGRTLKQYLKEREGRPRRGLDPQDPLAGDGRPRADAPRELLPPRRGARQHHAAADDRPVLLDFGAARRVISDMTQALTVILKPGYAPIEQYAEMPGIKQGPWTDIYALGAVVYFTITGRTRPRRSGG
jgi:hypothetical protein